MTRPILEGLVSAGFDAQAAIPITDDIFMSQDVSNCYLVRTGEGALLVNTGTTLLGEKHRERFERVSDEPIRTIVFTQSHPDHMGGWHAFDQPGIETIAQDDYFRVRRQWNQLGRFYRHRNARLWRGVTSEARKPGDPPRPKPVIPPDPVPTVTSTTPTASTSGPCTSSCSPYQEGRPPTRCSCGYPTSASCSAATCSGRCGCRTRTCTP